MALFCRVIKRHGSLSLASFIRTKSTTTNKNKKTSENSTTDQQTNHDSKTFEQNDATMEHSKTSLYNEVRENLRTVQHKWKLAGSRRRRSIWIPRGERGRKLPVSPATKYGGASRRYPWRIVPEDERNWIIIDEKTRTGNEDEEDAEEQGDNENVVGRHEVWYDAQGQPHLCEFLLDENGRRVDIVFKEAAYDADGKLIWEPTSKTANEDENKENDEESLSLATSAASDLRRRRSLSTFRTVRYKGASGTYPWRLRIGDTRMWTVEEGTGAHREIYYDEKGTPQLCQFLLVHKKRRRRRLVFSGPAYDADGYLIYDGQRMWADVDAENDSDKHELHTDKESYKKIDNMNSSSQNSASPFEKAVKFVLDESEKRNLHANTDESTVNGDFLRHWMLDPKTDEPLNPQMFDADGYPVYYDRLGRRHYFSFNPDEHDDVSDAFLHDEAYNADGEIIFKRPADQAKVVQKLLSGPDTSDVVHSELHLSLEEQVRNFNLLNKDGTINFENYRRWQRVQMHELDANSSPKTWRGPRWVEEFERATGTRVADRLPLSQLWERLDAVEQRNEAIYLEKYDRELLYRLGLLPWTASHVARYEPEASELRSRAPAQYALRIGAVDRSEANEYQNPDADALAAAIRAFKSAPTSSVYKVTDSATALQAQLQLLSSQMQQVFRAFSSIYIADVWQTAQFRRYLQQHGLDESSDKALLKEAQDSFELERSVEFSEMRETLEDSSAALFSAFVQLLPAERAFVSYFLNSINSSEQLYVIRRPLSDLLMPATANIDNAKLVALAGSAVTESAQRARDEADFVKAMAPIAKKAYVQLAEAIFPESSISLERDPVAIAEGLLDYAEEFINDYVKRRLHDDKQIAARLVKLAKLKVTSTLDRLEYAVKNRFSPSMVFVEFQRRFKLLPVSQEAKDSEKVAKILDEANAFDYYLETVALDLEDPNQDESEYRDVFITKLSYPMAEEHSDFDPLTDLLDAEVRPGDYDHDTHLLKDVFPNQRKMFMEDENLEPDEHERYLFDELLPSHLRNTRPVAPRHVDEVLETFPEEGRRNYRGISFNQPQRAYYDNLEPDGPFIPDFEIVGHNEQPISAEAAFHADNEAVSEVLRDYKPSASEKYDEFDWKNVHVTGPFDPIDDLPAPPRARDSITPWPRIPVLADWPTPLSPILGRPSIEDTSFIRKHYEDDDLPEVGSFDEESASAHEEEDVSDANAEQPDNAAKHHFFDSDLLQSGSEDADADADADDDADAAALDALADPFNHTPSTHEKQIAAAIMTHVPEGDLVSDPLVGIPVNPAFDHVSPTQRLLHMERLLQTRTFLRLERYRLWRERQRKWCDLSAHKQWRVPGEEVDAASRWTFIDPVLTSWLRTNYNLMIDTVNGHSNWKTVQKQEFVMRLQRTMHQLYRKYNAALATRQLIEKRAKRPVT